VDILVNNAGQAASAPFGRTDAALWQRMLDVNLTGAYHCIQATLPGMLDLGWGRIVNVASTAGLTGYRYVAAYCAAKHGLVGLTRALALEVAAQGVTVNAVCPGYTETDIVLAAVANIVRKTGRSEDQARAALAAANPQGRLVQPDEVAHAVAWLCMPGASAMNGQAVAVAGGEVM
jgi:NAD(P)-dependent dehydrogenase (short-subunit alcohol dehydrogenase family)